MKCVKDELALKVNQAGFKCKLICCSLPLQRKKIQKLVLNHRNASLALHKLGKALNANSHFTDDDSVNVINVSFPSSR